MANAINQWAFEKVKRLCVPNAAVGFTSPQLGKQLHLARFALQQASQGKRVAVIRGRSFVVVDHAFLVWLVDSLEGRYG